jgi:hypothetical protein
LNIFRQPTHGGFGRYGRNGSMRSTRRIRFPAMRTILGCRLHFLVSLEAGG